MYLHKIAFAFFFFLSAFGLRAQESKKIIHSLDIEFQNAAFDPSIGFGVRANHWFHQSERLKRYLGLMVHGFVAPGASPEVSGQLNEFNGNFHLRLHVSNEISFFEKRRLYTTFSVYGGLRLNSVSGSLDQDAQGFDRQFTKHTWGLDYGLRLGLGYRINDKVGLQISLTNSWLHISNPLGILPGLFFWGPDALALGGIGVNVRL